MDNTEKKPMEVVKYHNDFNQVYLGKLNAGEINLAFEIIAKVKNKGTAPIYFSSDDLKKNLPKNYTQHEFTNLIASLRRKFFKLDFTVIIERPDRIDEDIYNLFRRLTIHRDSESKEVTGLTIQVDEFFKYLVNDIKISFTRFELEELFQIRGSYAKKLYRLLKQHRHTGVMVMGWDEFKDQMGFPQKYEQRDVSKYVLNPAVEELKEERTVKGVLQPTFKNLKYKKLTSKGNGRKITAIEFTFDTEKRVEVLPKENNGTKAQDVCPYAVGTDLWYVWHHKTPPVKVKATTRRKKIVKDGEDFQLEPQKRSELM